MFTVSPQFLTLLQSKSPDLITVFEFYAFDFQPFPEPASGNLSFDPRHALKRFAAQNITFDLDGDSVVYERQVIEAPSIQKHIGKQFDTASLKLSNVDRTTAAWVLSERIQGMRMVVRMISRSTPTNDPSAVSDYADSIILFVGRVNKPDNFNRQSGTISATQDLGSIEAQIPPRQFQPTCPLKFKGAECLGSEVLSAKTATYKAAKICNKSFAQCDQYSNTEFFQGTRIVPIASSFIHKSNESFFKKILNILPGISRKKTVVGSSIHDGTPYGTPIALVFGRWKRDLILLQYKDTGATIWFKMAACRGTIHDFDSIRCESVGFSPPLDIVKHLGEYGGVGTQTQDTVFPDQSFHSKLAYITGRCIGSNVEVEDAGPPISAMIVGQVVRQAFGTVANGTASVSSDTAGYTDGGATYTRWADNPVDLARFVITDPALLNLPESQISQRATVRTASYCIGPIKDVSNAERCLLPDTEVGKAGVDYKRYTSTGLIAGRSFRVGSAVPQAPNGTPNREATYEFFPESSPPTSLALKVFYRKRSTANLEVNEQKKAIDLLYDTLLTCFRGFIRWDQHGLLAIDCERPADHSYLRQDVLSGVTSIKVLDVFPWKPLTVFVNEPDALRGKVLIGAHKLTSEVRPITTANYSADGNAITLSSSATGGLTAVSSGANLAGGSSTVPSSGTITVGGTPTVGATLTAVVNGYTIVVTATSEDLISQIPDSLSMAEQLAYAINAEPVLQDYVVAERGVAGGSTVDVLVYAKYGVLNFSTALQQNHFAEIADPAVAPVLAASAGALAAGAYQVAYAYRNANGNTNISPIASITLTASQKIDVSTVSLPAGATSIDWFVSVEANSGTRLLVANNNGTAFSINALPESTDTDEPKINTTGEEMLRVMKSSAQRALVYADSTRAWNIDGSFSWPEGSKQSTINQVKGKYREAIRDFGEQPVTINDERHQELIGKVNSADIDISAVDNFNQASRLMNGYLAKLRDGDFFFKWQSSGDELLLEVGDVVCLSDDSGAWRNVPVRIEEMSYTPDFKVSFNARLYSTSMFDDAVLQTDVPLPSALVNFMAGPPDISFNTVDYPPNGLVQSTTGVIGITTVLGGGVTGASSFPQFVNVRLIMRAGVVVNQTILAHATPDVNGEVHFEFPAAEAGLYEVELEVCDHRNLCNASKPTAQIVIGLGGAQALWTTPMIQISGSGTVGPSGSGGFTIP